MRRAQFTVAFVGALLTIGVLAVLSQADVWQINGTKLKTGASESIGCKIKSAKITLTAVVAGAKMKLTATGVECIEGKIIQSGEGATGTAADSGKLKFTGISVVEPAGCTSTASITTNALATKILMGAGEIAYDEFKPAVAGGSFFVLPLEECAAEGEYPLRGNFFGQGNDTGVAAVEQPLKFSEAIQTAAGGALTLGAKPGQIEGELLNFLAGANNGKTFATTRE
jgi:hypothetical protein